MASSRRRRARTGLPLFHRACFVTTSRATKDMRRFPARRRGGRVVECTALEMRHTGNRIGGSNPSLSARLFVYCDVGAGSLAGGVDDDARRFDCRGRSDITPILSPGPSRDGIRSGRLLEGRAGRPAERTGRRSPPSLEGDTSSASARTCSARHPPGPDEPVRVGERERISMKDRLYRSKPVRARWDARIAYAYARVVLRCQAGDGTAARQ